MQHLADLFLVGLAVLASAAYALFALGPRRFRSRAAASIAGLAARAASIPGLRWPLRRLSAHLADKAQSSCGGCANCGSEAGATEDQAADVRVPISKIGARGGASR